VAVMLERFPNLTPAQVVSLLLQNAEDLGVTGADSLYGRGVVDLTAAMQPAGGLRVAGGASGQSVDGARLSISEPLNGNLAAALSDIPVQDAYNRTYLANLSGSATRQSEAWGVAPVLEARAVEFLTTEQSLGDGTSLSVGFTDDTMGANSGSIGLHDERKRGQYASLSQSFGAMGTFSFGQNLNSRQAGLDDTPQTALLSPLSRGAETPFFSFVQEGTQAAWRGHLDTAWSWRAGYASGTPAGADDRTLGMSIDDNTLFYADATYHTQDGHAVGVTSGSLSERQALLGTRGTGGLGLSDQTDTTYASVHGQATLGEGWTLHGRYTVATSRADAVAGSAFSGIDTLTSNSWHVSLWKNDLIHQGDGFFASLSQPLQVDSGIAYSNTLSSFDSAGLPQTNQTPVSLAREGAIHDMEIGYALPLSKNTQLSAQGWWRFDEASSASSRTQDAYVMRYQWRFPK
jgi:hypothetical protein